MKRIPFYISLFLSGLSFTACEKEFLKTEKTGSVILSDTRDYDLLLNTDVINNIWSWPIMMLSDDAQMPDPLKPLGSVETQAIYSWQDEAYFEKDPVLWTAQYHAVYHNNVVINELDAAIGGTPAEKATLKAEAYLGRAFAHLLLLNIYSKSYDNTTAATDPGIPYVESSDMYQPLPSRSTVKETYEKIIQDIGKAIPFLPEQASMNHRGSKAAAYGLLSRVYLLSMQYEKAIEFAEKALAINSFLYNYAAVGFVRPAGSSSAENIYLRQVYENSNSRLKPVTAYSSLLPNSDSRKRLFIPGNSFRTLSLLQTGLSVQEVMLNKAEALVRKTTPDIDAALTLVNALNAKRDAAPVALTTADPVQALTWVLNERRREMAASGLRWIDARRLAKEGRTPAITRQLLGTTYTLEPDSKKYTLMIPRSVINFNPGMPQNER